MNYYLRMKSKYAEESKRRRKINIEFITHILRLYNNGPAMCICCEMIVIRIERKRRKILNLNLYIIFCFRIPSKSKFPSRSYAIKKECIVVQIFPVYNFNDLNHRFFFCFVGKIKISLQLGCSLIVAEYDLIVFIVLLVASYNCFVLELSKIGAKFKFMHLDGD